MVTSIKLFTAWFSGYVLVTATAAELLMWFVGIKSTMNFQTGLMMLWTEGLNGTQEIFITEINFLDLNDDVIDQKVFHRDFTFTKHGIIIGGDYRTWNFYSKWRELKEL